MLLFTGRIIFRSGKAVETNDHTPLSLLLTVRNEEVMLRNNLPPLLTIDGVDYEVIAVDDFSQDSTYLVLGSLKTQYRRLKISSLNDETRFSLKLSQNIALKAAAFDWVLPVPVSLIEPKPGWLLSFVGKFDENNSVIIGYSSIKSAKSFINQIYRVGNYWLFMKSIGYTFNGLPLVYSDENIAFRKQKYFEVGGYGTKIKEPYANLELIINKFIRKKSTSILFTPESTIRKKQDIQWKDYLDLLKKSFRIEKHLSLMKQIFLRTEELTQLLFLTLSIFVIILLPELWITYLMLFVIKIAGHLLIIKISQKRLREPKIFISSLMYGVIIPFFNLFYRWYFNYRSRKNKWRSTA